METVKSGSLATKILVFILAMLLGMAILVGAVAGTLYAAVAWVSLDRLQGLGVGINADGFLEEDSPLRTLSLLEIIAEFSKISSDLSASSMASLVDTYGVILPEAMFAFVPEEMMDIPLSDYRDKGILNVYLSTATVGHALALAGQDVLPEAARVKMEDRTLNLLVEQKLDLLFEGVYAGDLMGIAVEKGSDGVVVPVPVEGEDFTISSYLATLDLGEYFAAEDRNAVLQATLDRTPMSVLVEGSGGNPIYNAMVDKHLGDILKLEAGGFYFDLDNALEGMTLGDTLGYELDEEGNWRDSENNLATGLYAKLVPLKINELADTDLMGIVEDMYVGELMELEQGAQTSPATETADAKYEWSEDGIEITGMRLSLANLKVRVLMHEELNADTLGLNEHPLYEVLGYEKKTDGKWYDTAGRPVSGALTALMEIKVGDLSTGIDDLYVGELMGYTLQKKDGNFLDKNGNVVYRQDDGTFKYENGDPVPAGDAPFFKNDEGKVPTGASASIVSMLVADLDDPSKLDDKISTTKVGDAMGYYYKPDAENPDIPGEDLYYGTWYKDEAYSTEADGVMALLMNSTIDNLNSDIDKLYFGEFMGYDAYDTTTGKLADKNTPKANLVFRKEDGDDGYTEPSGLIGEFANLTIKDLRTEDTLNEKIDSTTIGTVLGYEYDETAKVWKKNGAEATGVLRSLMGTTVANMNDDINNLYIGEAMGYDAYDEADNPVDKKNPPAVIVFKKPDGTQPSEMMKAFADLTLDDLSNNEKAFGERVKKVKVGDAMGYEEHDGKWYTTYIEKGDGGNVEADGIMALLADSTIADIDTKLDSLYFGEFMDYDVVKDTNGNFLDKNGNVVYRQDDGTFKYGNGDAVPEGYAPVFRKEGGEEPSGMIGEFADLTIKELRDETTFDKKVDGIQLGIVLGYEYDETAKVWKKNGAEADGVLRTLMGTTVANMNTDINKLYLGEIMGFDAYDTAGDPVDKENPPAVIVFKKSDGTVPGTLMGAFADMKVSELENESNFTTRVKGIRVGDAMGYVEKNGKWYESYTNDTTNIPVTNKLLVSVIGNTVGNMDSVLKDLTLAQVMGYEEHGGIWYVTYDDDDPSKCVEVTGFTKLVGPTSKINEIDGKINDVKENATIQDYMDAGILDLSGSEDTLTDYFDMLHAADPTISADWQGYKLDGFIDAIIGGLDTIVGGS